MCRKFIGRRNRKDSSTEYLIELLQKSFKVAVLSRGYRRKSSGFLIADSNSNVADIGMSHYRFRESIRG